MKQRFSVISPRRKWMIAGCVAAYGLLLALLLVFAQAEHRQEQGMGISGSVEDRFLSAIVMEHEGKTHYYRENEIVNYLIVCRDGLEDAQSAEADFFMVLAIDRYHRTVTPVMPDRNAEAEVQTFDENGRPAETKKMPLGCALCHSGESVTGAQNAVQTVEAMLHGIVIQRCIVLDREAIALLNDFAGGIEITFEEDFTAYDPAFVKGASVRLSNEQAMAFASGEKTEADVSHALRMTRQRQFAAALLEQMHKTVAESGGAGKMIRALQEHIQTDTPLRTLVSDVAAYRKYEWRPLCVPEGTFTVDENGETVYGLDRDELKKTVLDIWFAAKIVKPEPTARRWR